MIAFPRTTFNSQSLKGREVVYECFGYEPHFLQDRIGVVVDAHDDDSCLVRFEIDGKQVVFCLPARELYPVKRNGGEA